MSMQNPTADLGQDDIPTPFSTAALFISAIFLGAVIGLTSPGAGKTLSQGIDTTLLIMVFLLFLELRFDAIVKAFGNLRFLSLAWGANFVLIPVIGYVIASLFFTGQPLLFAGLMIYFLAPCTDWFLGFTRMARGDAELGAALIPINMITQLSLFPLWLWVLTQNTGLTDVAAMPGMLLQWFVLPMIMAQALRFALTTIVPPWMAEKVLDWASRLLPFVLAALIFQLFATHIGVLTDDFRLFLLVILAVCLFFSATLILGEGLSRICRLAYPQRALLAMTMAARNAPLMLALTAVAIPNQPLVLAIIVSGMLVEIPLLTALRQLLLWRYDPES